MRYLLTLLALLASCASAQDLKSAPPYVEDVAAIYGEIRQVQIWEEVCSEQFPNTKAANRAAVKNWREQYSAFVQEMEQRYQNMLLQESHHNSERHKALSEHFAKAEAKAKIQFKELLLRGGIETFRKQCDGYANYLKTQSMDLEITQAIVVSRIRKIPIESDKLSLISEIVVNAKLDSSFRQGLKNSLGANSEDAYFKDKAAALPDAVLVRFMAEAYEKRLSYSDAKEVSDFYRSSAGKKLIEIQARNVFVPSPSYKDMSALELSLAHKFSRSPGTLNFRDAGRDPRFFAELAKRIREYVASNP